MDREDIGILIEDLYNVKDDSDRKFSGSIQIVIDLLDDLLMAGSIYLDEEE